MNGDSFMKISTTNGLVVADYFTPYNQASLQGFDLDLGSRGPVLLPDAAGSVAHPHLIVGPGKDGTVYLVDRDNMGHFQAGSDNQIVQSVSSAFGSSRIWSPPAYFNGLLFFQPSSGVMRSFAITNGALSSAAVSSSAVSFGQYNGGPVVSANGTNNAIVWVLNSAAFNSSGAGVRYAYNATNLATLYNSSQLLARDNPGAAVKMTTPTVAGGKVYVPAQYALSVFGVQLFLDTPVISPNGGNYFSSVAITLAAPDTNAVIYYTLDGSLPGTNSFLYAGAFNLTSNATIAASAFRTNFNNSVAPSALFFVSPLYFTSAGFLPNKQFQLGFAGVPGSNYVLQATTNFLTWTPVNTNLAVTNVFNLIDSKATNFPYRFYRVLQQ